MHKWASLAPVVTRAVSLTAVVLSGSLLPASAVAQGGAQPSSDWAAVDQALGRKGAAQPGGVMKYSFPRSDMQVTAGGVAVRPALALGSWVAFKRVAGGHAMAMGDLVLGEDEVVPVMAALQQGGVEQTALHNHVLHESPRVMYMHISAHGDAMKIAQTIRTALGQSRTPLAAPAAPAPAAAIDLDTAAVARALGASGNVNGGVYQVNVPRTETILEDGNEVPPAMGVATP